MPRLLLRDGGVVADDWHYLNELGANPTPGAGTRLILRFDEWTAERPHWLACGASLGVILAPATDVGALRGDLAHLDLVGADFPGPSEGRGYTQGRLLRERHGFRGELRAVGYVRRDQLFFLARCGFNSFELPEAGIRDAASAFKTFTAAYQQANDAGLARHPTLR